MFNNSSANEQRLAEAAAASDFQNGIYDPDCDSRSQYAKHYDRAWSNLQKQVGEDFEVDFDLEFFLQAA